MNNKTDKLHNHPLLIISLLLALSLFVVSLFFIIFGTTKKIYGPEAEHYITTIPVDIYIDGKLEYKESKIQRVKLSNVDNITLKCNVPSSVPPRFNNIVITTLFGSFEVYLDGEQIFSFPKNGGYFELSNSTFFMISANDLKDKEITINYNINKLKTPSSLIVYPIYISSDYGIVSSLKTSILFLQTTVSTNFMLLIVTIYIFIIERKQGNKKAIISFALLCCANLLATFASFKANILLYGNTIAWTTVKNFSRFFTICSYLTLIQNITYGNFIKDKYYKRILLFHFALFMLNTYLAINTAYFSYYIRLFINFCIIFISIYFVIKAIFYYDKSDVKLFLIISTIVFLASIILEYAFSAMVNRSYQGLIICTLRIVSACCLAFPLSSEYIKRQMKQIQQKEIDMYMNIDVLTGCLNRRKYENYIHNEENYKNIQTSIIFADINSLKRINDYFGHSEGDKIIKYCGRCLLNNCPSNSNIYRIGGDEFVAIFENTSAVNLNYLIKSLKENFKDNSPFCSTISMGGITVKAKNEAEFLSAIKKADELMYRDKINKDNYSLLVNARMISDEY